MRLVLAHEIPTSMRKLNEEKVKTLTADAVIITRTLNKGGHEWLPRMKIIFDLNDMPGVSDPNAVSLRRRIRAIPFKAKFEGNSKYMHSFSHCFTDFVVCCLGYCILFCFNHTFFNPFFFTLDKLCHFLQQKLTL